MKICLVCAGRFTPYLPTKQKICSVDCRREFRRAREQVGNIVVHCIHCGNELLQRGVKPRKYCSRQCYLVMQRPKANAFRSANQERLNAQARLAYHNNVNGRRDKAIVNGRKQYPKKKQRTDEVRRKALAAYHALHAAGLI